MTHSAMSITINGNCHPLDSETTLTELLSCLGLDSKPVLVELNKTAILARDFSDTEIKDGDSLEIVALAAGG